MLDAKARASVERHGADGAVPWVLMGAFLYYHRDATILSDGCYDELTQIVREDYPFITHPHKHLLASLQEGSSSTLFQLKEEEYPSIARNAALGLLRSTQVDR